MADAVTVLSVALFAVQFWWVYMNMLVLPCGYAVMQLLADAIFSMR